LRWNCSASACDEIVSTPADSSWLRQRKYTDSRLVVSSETGSAAVFRLFCEFTSSFQNSAFERSNYPNASRGPSSEDLLAFRFAPNPGTLNRPLRGWPLAIAAALVIAAVITAAYQSNPSVLHAISDPSDESLLRVLANAVIRDVARFPLVQLRLVADKPDSWAPIAAISMAFAVDLDRRAHPSNSRIDAVRLRMS
jgi:hypothetical protein